MADDKAVTVSDRRNQSSVEITMGQSGKVGCAVKVYDDDETVAYERAVAVIVQFRKDKAEEQ